jgi:hypothetical protein
MLGRPARLAGVASVAPLALPLLTAAACAGAQRAAPDARPVSAAVPWASAPPTRHFVERDSVIVWLFAPTEVRSGEPVPMRVELENVAGQMLVVQLGGHSPRADFVVTAPSGGEVWRFYRNYVPLGGIGSTALDVGERLVIPFEWRQQSNSASPPGPSGPRVAPGQYFLHARVRFAQGDVETPKRPLRITR